MTISVVVGKNTTISLEKARAAKEEGIALVIKTNYVWLEQAIAMFDLMKFSFPLGASGEQMRLWLLSHGLHKPKSPNAWGALINTAVKRKLLVDTGRSVQMHTEKSHARRTPLWEFVDEAALF